MTIRKLIHLSALVLVMVSCGKKAATDNADHPDQKQADHSKTAANGQNPTSETRDYMPLPPEDQQMLPNTSLSNLDDLIQKLDLKRFHKKGHHGQNLKIAVLDNGFMGVKQSIGTRLPPDTVVIAGKGNAEQETLHGTKLAEIVYGLATGKNYYSAATIGPRLVLINSNGFTNFKAAVDYVIQEDIDMVLYSQVWEYGGNMDGKGFINQEVNRAIDAGVLWVNAAGNFGKTTFESMISINSSQQVMLPSDGKYVRFRVPFDGTYAKIVLSWNDFDESKDYRTPQDLNLYIEDKNGQVVEKSILIQDGVDHKGDPKYSAHAREIIKSYFKTGEYRIRVDAASKNFDDLSRLRITIDGIAVEMLDRSTENSILIPADNPRVLTVGASDVDYSAVTVFRNGLVVKPEFIAPSEVRYDNGERFAGTSSAAAVAVGALAVLQSSEGKMTKDQIVEKFSKKP